MRGHDRAGERICELGIDTALLGEMIERLRLVEAPHLDRPFDRLAVAAEREPPVRPARDRDHPPVERGRKRAIDLKLGLAGGLALVERRIVEEREFHRALDLQRAFAGKEDRGRMGVDAGHLLPAVGRGIGEEFEHSASGSPSSDTSLLTQRTVGSRQFPPAATTAASEEDALLVDHRTYFIKPTATPQYFETYEKYGYRAQVRHLGEPIAYLFGETGEVNDVVHLWAYEDAADRAKKRAAMFADPEWKVYLQSSPKAACS